MFFFGYNLKMKKALFLLFLILTPPLLAQNYTTDEARQHIGEYATVCGYVSGGYYAKHTHKQPTFINLDGVYPHHRFSIVIWGSNRSEFQNPQKDYLGKKICVSGRIGSYRGKAQMIIEIPEQILVLTKEKI